MNRSLATVIGVTLTAVQEGNGHGRTIQLTDGTEFLVRDETAIFDLSSGTTYDSITGIVQQFNGAFQIIPSNQRISLPMPSAVRAVTASPASGMIPAGTEVTLSTGTSGATIYFTTNGDEPTNLVRNTANQLSLIKIWSLKAIAVKAGLRG